jgi:diacylglycerol kinase
MIHHIRHRLYKHTISFKHAFEGIIWALKTQPNYQIHLALAFASLAGAYYYKITYSEFLALIILIFIGLSIETINTSIEKLADAVDTNFNENIKIAKDTGAGAMLFFAFGATITACIIFLPRIFG